MVASSPHVEEHQWFAIVNPVAGNGRGLDEFPRISKLLREQQIHCEAVFSEHKFHAVELTVEAVRRGYRRIIAVGGTVRCTRWSTGCSSSRWCLRRRCCWR